MKLTNKKKYQVKSGELDCVVSAHNEKQAIKKALTKYKPNFLGLIISCGEIGKEEKYCLTKNILTGMGAWKE